MSSQSSKKSSSGNNRKKKTSNDSASSSATKPLLGNKSAGSNSAQSSKNNKTHQKNNGTVESADTPGGDPGGSGVDPGDPSASKNGGGLFRPLVVLAGVNLFRRFSSQYRRLPQEPPKDRLEQELERLNNKIDSLLDKLEEVKPEAAQSPDEECIVCAQNKATMQTFPCGHQVVCRMCFVKTIQTAVTEKKLPLRCVFCRAKILRLKQHHKMVNAPGTRPPHRSASCHSNSSTASAPASTTAAVGAAATAMPQSASNYSFNRMTSSSSNHSFASGVSSVSSASSASSKSTRNFNFDSFSNFQSVNLINKSQLTRTTSGSSYTGWRRSRSPSPLGTAHRSRSVDVRIGSACHGGMPKITVDRTPSDESINSSAQLSMTSPGSSSSPRSPISPPWSTGSRSPGMPCNASAPSAFFPTSPLSPGSPAGSPASPSGYSGFSSCPDSTEHHPVIIIPVPIAPPVSANRMSRMCTPLSPIKESVRENGSSLELRCSPERTMTSSPPMSIEALELENLSLTSSERENPRLTSSMGRSKKRLSTLATFNHPLLDFDATHSLLNNNNNNNNNITKTQPSSRIRCADKILSQLEMQANLSNNLNEAQPAKPSIKPYSDQGRNNNESDRHNANKMGSTLATTGHCNIAHQNDNSKLKQAKNRTLKSVTFKDC